MRCEEVRRRWAEGAPGEAAADDPGLAGHLSNCPACQREFASLDAVWQGLAGLPAPVVPSTRMRARFEATLASGLPATGQSSPRPPQAPAWRDRLRPVMPVIQGAVAASLLLAGVLIGRSTTPDAVSAPARSAASADEIAAVRGELREMRQMLTLSLLQQQSAAERLRGVSASAQLEQPGNEVVAALLDTLLHDPNENVRLAAIDALRRFSDRDEVRQASMRAAAESTSPLLQVAAIDFVAESGDGAAAPFLRRLSQDDTLDASVRGRAAQALARLSS